MVGIHIEEVVFDTLGWIWGARAFIEEMERTLPGAEIRERDALHDLANELNWDDESLSEERSAVESKWDYWIPRVLSYSLVTLLHSIVETQLTALCGRLQDIHSHALKVKEISGDPIERAKIYLTKVVGLGVGSDTDWETIRDLAKLRHVIVHRGGAVGAEPKQQSEVDALVKKYSPELQLQIGYVRPSLTLCKRFLDAIEAFYRRLFRAAGLPERAMLTT